MLYAELRRTAELCRELQLNRDELHALPAATVDELLVIDDERSAWLAELRSKADGRGAEDSV